MRGVHAMQGGAISRSIVSSIEKRIALPALEEAEMAFSRALQSITIVDLVSHAAMGLAACAQGLEGNTAAVNVVKLPVSLARK